MRAATHPGLRVVVYEGAGSESLDDSQRYDAIKALLEKGFAVTRATGDGHVTAPDGRTLLVLGRFHDADALRDARTDTDVTIHVHDAAGMDTESILNTVEQVAGQVQPDEHTFWKPWFPVIDYKRCTNCMQCLSFCLFDVYGVSVEGQILVQNQSNCKTDCPACSRVCPEVAILFPKYRNGPINGDEVSEDDVQREKMKVDISSLLGGDIYAALRDRSVKAKSRFSKERDDEKALKERQRCLEKLKEQLGDMDIPPEVFASLPSQAQIRAKAEAALDAAKQSSTQ